MDDAAGASVFGRITGNDVTIGARRQSRGKSPVQNAVFVVESDESPIAARKGNLVVAVVPPGREAEEEIE